MSSGSFKGRQNTAAQNSVAERRLRPIYEYLDLTNHKKALQEADRVLKKAPDFLCCKALKALILVRMGRAEEAQPILDRALQEAPTDDATLQAMSVSFRELQQLDKICTMYENATKKEPTEDLLSHLFMAYVRVSDFKNQQQAAMALFKATDKNPYYFWAVMSIVLQATNGHVGEELATSLSLPLAERMIEKRVKEDKIGQEQETHLYLMVLELQHKFQKALEVIEGPLGKKLHEHTTYLNLVNTRKLNYLKKVENWPRVRELATEMLLKDPDQWSVYVDYVDSIFHSVGAVESGHVKEAVEFFLSRKEGNPQYRGPFLAHIELKSRLIARSNANATEEVELTDLLVNYFQSLAAKQICAFDLKLFLPALSKKEVERFFERTLEVLSLDANKAPSSAKAVHQHVCWLRLQRLMGFHNSPAADVQARWRLATQLFQNFEDCLPILKDLNVGEMEIPPNDEYVVLGGSILWDLWQETEDDKYFWKAVVFLSYVLKTSPANYSLRFLLIKFFNHAGAVACSHYVHEGLELKQIQLDSLGYLMSRHIQTCGHFTASSSLLGKTLKFYTGNYKDAVEYIMSAYRYGSFDKIREFIKLRDRLSSSQHYASLTVDSMLLDLVLESTLHGTTVQMMSFLEVDPSKDEIRWSELSDNRDFSPLPCWESPERSLSCQQNVAGSFIHEQKFLKYRSLAMRALVASVYMSENIHPATVAAASAISRNAGIVANGHDDVESQKLPSSLSDAERSANLRPILKNLLEEMSAHHSQVKADEPPPSLEEALAEYCSIQGPDPVSRLCVYLSNRHAELLISLLSLVVRSHELAALPPPVQSKEETEESRHRKTLLCEAEDLVQAIAGRFKEVVESLREKINVQGSKLIHRDLAFESIINAAESSSFAAILCGVCQTLLKSGSNFRLDTTTGAIQSKTPGKGKKKKSNCALQGGSAGSSQPSAAEPHRDTAQFTSAFNAMIQHFESGISDMISTVMDFEKVVALDALTVELNIKFSQLGLKPDEEGGETSENHEEKKDKLELIRDISMDALQEDLRGQLERSYAESFAQINMLLQNKLFYFGFLKV